MPLKDAGAAVAAPPAAWPNAKAYADWVSTHSKIVASATCNSSSSSEHDHTGKPPVLTARNGHICATFYERRSVTVVKVVPRGGVSLDKCQRDLSESTARHIARVASGAVAPEAKGRDIPVPVSDTNPEAGPRSAAIAEFREFSTRVRRFSIVRNVTALPIESHNAPPGQSSSWVVLENDGEPHATVMYFSAHGFSQTFHVTPISSERDSLRAFGNHLEHQLGLCPTGSAGKPADPPPQPSPPDPPPPGNGDASPPVPPNPDPPPTTPELRLTPNEVEAYQHLLSFDPTGSADSFTVDAPSGLLKSRFGENGLSRYTALCRFGLICLGGPAQHGRGRTASILRRSFQAVPSGTHRPHRSLTSAPASPPTPVPTPTPPVVSAPNPTDPPPESPIGTDDEMLDEPTSPPEDDLDGSTPSIRRAEVRPTLATPETTSRLVGPPSVKPGAAPIVADSSDDTTVQTALSQLTGVCYGMAHVMRHFALALPHLRELHLRGCIITMDGEGFKLHAPFTILDDQPPE